VRLARLKTTWREIEQAALVFIDRLGAPTKGR